MTEASEAREAVHMFAPRDREELRKKFQQAQPFPFVEITPFLTDEAIRELSDAYPSLQDASKMGTQFNLLNERGKVQVTDLSLFPSPVRRLHEAISTPEFVKELEYITGIPSLLADEQLLGGGMHMTGPRGRLDVHVDFNFIEQAQLHRRLNLLLYLNPTWEAHWGGDVELWDRDMKYCRHAFSPILNRCIVFATSDISFHGVSKVTCPSDHVRKSFASYYYTKEAPEGWTGEKHSTIFKARPNEQFRGSVLMPLEKAYINAYSKARSGLRQVKSAVTRRIKQ